MKFLLIIKRTTFKNVKAKNMKKTIIKSSLFAVICLLAISSKSFAQNDEPLQSSMKFDSCYLNDNFKTLTFSSKSFAQNDEPQDSNNERPQWNTNRSKRKRKKLVISKKPYEYEPKKPNEYECLKCKRLQYERDYEERLQFHRYYEE
jgi:hypothetical protein